MVKNNKKKEEAIENISLIKAKPPKNVTNRDQYARMSHLYQISQCLSTRVENEALSRYYAQTMDSVSKKTVLKMYGRKSLSLISRFSMKLILL